MAILDVDQAFSLTHAGLLVFDEAGLAEIDGEKASPEGKLLPADGRAGKWLITLETTAEVLRQKLWR